MNSDQTQETSLGLTYSLVDLGHVFHSLQSPGIQSDKYDQHSFELFCA